MNRDTLVVTLIGNNGTADSTLDTFTISMDDAAKLGIQIGNEETETEGTETEETEIEGTETKGTETEGAEAEGTGELNVSETE